MQTAKTKVMFIMALVLAGIAAWLANTWVQQKVAGNAINETVADNSVSVVVAATDLAYGQEIEAAHLRTAQWPKDSIPAGAMLEIDKVAGRVATQNIIAGDIVTERRTAEHMAGSRLAALVAENKRAVSVRVDDVVGVSGFILPGNRVDVMGVRKLRSNNTVRVRTVLENIKVLAVDQDVSQDKDKPKLVRSVTLELTRIETEDLIKASHEGKIQLALRNPLDTNIAKRKQEAPVRKKSKKVVKDGGSSRPASAKVTVIRGTSVETTRPKI